VILEEATFEAYSYCPRDFKPKSNKPILAACELCGEFRVTSKRIYHTFCKSCGSKNKNLLGNRNPNYGKRGSETFNYKDGFRTDYPRKYMQFYHRKYKKTINGIIAIGRNNAKRRRELSYTLLMPLKEDEVGHHVTDEYVIGIPEDVHQQFSGYKREKHRALVLEWLKENDPKKYRVSIAALETLLWHP